jgi:oligopeptide transport system ATP-binding protein
VEDLCIHPSHPALGLGKPPRIDTHERERLVSIQGAPPDLVDLTPGCPFLSRCRYAIDRCKEENPPLMPVSTTHESACWVDVTTGRPR